MSSGIKHIEFWTADFDKILNFYETLFNLIGWEKVSSNAFKSGDTKIYFKLSDKKKLDTLGPRHICFWAESRGVVDQVGDFLRKQKIKIIRGPVEINEEMYSPGYYTVDFYDPDGCILEVAHN